MSVYLADSSIWAWANRAERPDIRLRLADRFEGGEVATCAPVLLEVMHRARTGAQYAELFAQLFEPLDRLPLTDDVAQRALDVQRTMADTAHGYHLRPAVDYLIAAIAEAAGDQTTLWFFDRDLRVICEQTGQPFEAEESTGPGH